MKKGKLIVFEGIDGAGKSTNMDLVELWLLSKGVHVLKSAWKSSNIVEPAITEGKKNHSLKPKTFSILHAADFYDRMDKQIIPFLKSGGVVLCDRYVYTAFVRDSARGLDLKWVYNLYQYAKKPDLVFYFKTPVEKAMERIKGRGNIGFYEAGMDVGTSNKLEESYKIFQTRLTKHYNILSKQYGFTEIDSSQSLNKIQKELREKISSIL